MLKQVPDDLPLFGALSGALGFLAFGFTGMFVEGFAGRPSSTASLGIIFIPIWSALFGCAGLLFGTLTQTIWRRLKPGSLQVVPTGQGLKIALLIVIIGSAVAGVASVLIYEAGSKPTVMSDAGVVSVSPAANTSITVRKSIQLYGGPQAPQKNISWGQNETQIVVDGLNIRLSDRKRSVGGNLKAPGLDYITYVHAAGYIISANQNPFLVAVITGRATGHRALIAVLDTDYRVLYQSRIELYCPSEPLEIRREVDSQDEIAVIGPRCDEPLILKKR